MIAAPVKPAPPGAAIVFYLWQRHRRGLSLIAGYIGVLILGSAFLPGSAVRAESFFAFSVIPLAFAALYLVAVFTHPDADIAAPGSGYPTHLMLLPVRTRDLVFWPMALGAATITLAWLVVAGFVYRPNGIGAPLFWPAALMAASLACMQALFWSPIVVPYVRAAAAVSMLPVVLVAGTLMKASGYPEAVITTLYLCVIPAAYLLAKHGVEKARHGDTNRQLIVRSVDAVRTEHARMRPPFPTATHAQRWLEWARNGWALPLVTAVSCLLASTPLLWVHDSYPLLRGGVLDPIARYFDVEVNVTVRVATVCYILPVVFASILGCNVRRPAGRRKEPRLPSFLAVRPIRNLELIKAKATMAAGSTLAAWAVLLAFTALWMTTPARRGDETGSLGAVLLHSFTPAGLAAVMGFAALLIFWTWRNMVQSLFVDFTGRVTLVETYRLGLVMGSSIVLFVFAALSADPAMSSRLETQAHTLFAAGIVLKTGLSVWAVREIRRGKILSDPLLLAFAAAWVVATGVIFAGLRFFIPSNWVDTTRLAAAVLLFVPAARLLLAPVSLHRSRHQ